MSNSALRRISKYYNVHAEIGEQVMFKDRVGIITGSSNDGTYVMVRMVGELKSLPYDPRELQWILTKNGTRGFQSLGYL